MLINAFTARQNFFKLIEQAIDHHEAITVTAKSGNVVIISEDDYKLFRKPYIY